MGEDRGAAANKPRRSDLLQVALDLADIARAAVLPHFRTPGLVTVDKGRAGFDPVTEADRAAEAAMRAHLAQIRPQDAVQGEEEGATPGQSGLVWVLDPIDGTRAFLSGAPTWGVLIALCNADGPLLGVIDQPWTAERFVGSAEGAWADGPRGRTPLATRQPRPLREAILFSTFPEIGSIEERTAFEGLSARCRLTRYGLDCYAYALVALGQIDLVVEAGLHAYDVCAPIAVIEAAGGIVTDWQGRPAHNGGRILAAANAEIHAEALAILSQA
ncbi:MAG: histidinol-phosphatase [Alkalilacustris sp.]